MKSNPSVTKKVAPKPCFFSKGAAIVTCDLLASSKVRTTSLSGIGSRASAGVVRAKISKGVGRRMSWAPIGE